MLDIRSIFSRETLNRNVALPLATMLVALIVATAAYSPGLSGPLLLDDLPQLQGMIDNSADAPEALFNKHIISISGPFGRPVAMGTFISSAVTHGPDIWWWKYENVMFHLITGLLIFWLTALLLKETAKPDQRKHWLIAATVASFWLLHPLHVSTVLYIVQRMTELSSLFVVAGLICYVKGRQRQIHSDGKGWVQIFLGFCVFFPLAALSKESALLFPVFCSLLEVLLFRFQGNSKTRKQIKAFHSILAGGYVLIALYVIVNFSNVVIKAYEIREFTLSERIYTEFRVVVLYLSQILLPVQGKMGFFHDDFSLSTSLFSPVTTILSALLLIALLASAVLLRKRLPLYAFGVLFFFVGHALESTIFALELVYEHRNYLPSLGILLAGFSILQEFIRRRNALVWIAVIGLGSLSLLTWQRADTWGSPFKLYEFMHYAHPQSPRLNLLFVNIYGKMENFEKARESLSRMPDSLGPRINRLYLDCMEHQRVTGSDILDLLRMPDGVLTGHVGSSTLVLAQEMLTEQCSVPKREFLALLEHLLSLSARSLIDHKILFITKARVLESMGSTDAAISALQSAHELQPDSAEALYFSAHTLSMAGRLDEATSFLTAAYELEKTSRIRDEKLAITVYLNIGKKYSLQGQLEKSLAVYAEGVLSVPKEPRLLILKIEKLIQLQLYENSQEAMQDLRMLDDYDLAEHRYSIRILEAALRDGIAAAAPTHVSP